MSNSEVVSGEVVLEPTRLVSPAGVPVTSYTPPTNAEVMAEASQKCGTCKGRGHYHAWIKQRVAACDNSGKIEGVRLGPCAKKCICEADMQIRVPRVCMCAVRRWEKKNGVECLSGHPIAKPFVDAFTGKQKRGLRT